MPSDLYPIAILQDRYGGAYSRGAWLAIAQADEMDNGCYRIVRCLENGPLGSDTSAMMFWGEPPEWIAVGDTPQGAVANLKTKLSAEKGKGP